MKHVGCLSDFTDQRNEEIMIAYRNAIRDVNHIDIIEIAKKIVNTQCSRFWVSEERTMFVIIEIEKGRPILDTMRPNKRELFQELYRRVCSIRKNEPDKSLEDAIYDSINSPAPCFYLTPRSVLETIYKIKNGFYANRPRNYRIPKKINTIKRKCN